jgi:hypothetical protein
MKKVIISIIIMVLISLRLVSQDCIGVNSSFPCCNQNINIDPLDNGIRTQNTERLNSLLSLGTINFSNFNINWLKNEPFYVLSSTGVVKPKNNPLLSTDLSYSMVSNWDPVVENFDKLVMHPKNGWQLMHHYDGYRAFSSTPMSTINGASKQGYHYMFYNKYTGQARFLVSPETNSDYNPTDVSVAFYFPGSGVINTSAIFNWYSGRMKALDKFTTETNVRAFLSNGQNFDESYFGTSDIDLSYDPCVCVKTSTLKMEVRKRTKLSLYAEGKYAGITKPFDNSGNIPASYGKNWLSSVSGEMANHQDFEIKGGFQVYKTAEEMAKQYYVSAGAQFAAMMLNLFGNLGSSIPPIKLGTSSLQEVSAYIGQLPPTISTQAQAIWNTVEKSKYKIPIGSALSLGAQKISASINPAVPNVSFTEGQLALRGKIEGDLVINGFSSREISHPGSLGSLTTSFDKYPYYNEAVGHFAIVKTPKIYFDINKQNDIAKLKIHLQAPIKYALNPTSDIDVSKSELLAGLEFDYYLPYLTENFAASNFAWVVDKNEADSIINYIFKDNFIIVKKTILHKSEVEQKNGALDLHDKCSDWNKLCDSVWHFVIQTRQVPIDKISNFTYFNDLTLPRPTYTRIQNYASRDGIFKNLHNNEALNNTLRNRFNLFFDFRLLISAKYEFKDNYYGKVNGFIKKYVFELEYESTPSVNSNRLDRPPLIIPDTIYTSSWVGLVLGNVIKAKTIIINSNISNLTLHATKGIIHESGIISPNVIQEIVKLDFDQELINPVDNLYLKNFCSNSDYRAGFSYKTQINSLENKITPYSLSLHPNPASSVAKLTLTNYQNSNVNVKIFDLMGREMLEVIEKDITNREHNVDLDIERLAPGTYIIKVNNGFDEKATKLVVVRY